MLPGHVQRYPEAGLDELPYTPTKDDHQLGLLPRPTWCQLKGGGGIADSHIFVKVKLLIFRTFVFHTQTGHSLTCALFRDTTIVDVPLKVNSSKSYRSILINGSTSAAAMFSTRVRIPHSREPTHLGNGHTAPLNPPEHSPPSSTCWPGKSWAHISS